VKALINLIKENLIKLDLRNIRTTMESDYYFTFIHDTKQENQRETVKAKKFES